MPGSSGENGGRAFDDQFLVLFDGTSDSSSGNFPSRPSIVRIDDGMAKRDASLKQALRYLCGHAGMDSSDIEYFVNYFISLYTLDRNGGRFRHKYSDVCDVMYSHFSDDAQSCDEVPAAIVYLENNIESISEKFQELHPGSEEFSRFFKLKDHVFLEGVRARKQMSWNSSFFTRISNLSNDVSDAQDRLDKSVETTMSSIDSVREELDKSKRDYIAILGIFAAVVLVFNGAVSFSTSAIGSTAGHHPFSVGFVILLVGFVLFNSIVALFTFLRMMVRESAPWKKWHAYVFMGIDAILLVALIAMFFVIKDAYWL